jgi:hypothetical protein
MKRIITLIVYILLFTSLTAQESRFENVKLKLSQSNDSLIVNYDLSGKRTAFDVKLLVTNQEGQLFKLRNVTGDIGNHIRPGKDKTIFWEMKVDQIDIFNTRLLVKVTGKVFIPETVKKKIWIPWLYIAAGISAATGTYAQIRANRIYEDYPPSSTTDEAEKLYKDYNRMLKLRNGAFGAAGGFGIAGVVVHIKHHQKKRAVSISYLPAPEMAIVGLNLKF